MAAMKLCCLLTWACVLIVGTRSEETTGSFFLSGVSVNTILKLDLGSKSYVNLSTSKDVSALAYDNTSHRIFYGSTFDIFVYSMDMEGKGIRPEATTDLYVQAIAFDTPDKYMFVYSVNKGRIYKIDHGKDSSIDNGQIVWEKERDVFHMVVIHETRKLLWGSYTGVYQSYFNGSDKERLMNTTGYIDGLAYDESYIYVMTKNTIWKLDRKTRAVNRLFTSLTSITGLTIVGNRVYFVNMNCVMQQCGISVRWVTKDGNTNGTSFTLRNRTGYGTINLVYAPPRKDSIHPDNEQHEHPINKDLTGSFLLSGLETFSILKLDLESKSNISLPSPRDVSALAYDCKNQRIFYGSTFDIHVYSMDMKGRSFRMEATTDLYVQAIAIDRINQCMFVYSPGGKGKIFKIDLRKESSKDNGQIILHNESEVFHMEVDHNVRKLIWGSYTGVYQSTYSGTEKVKLMDSKGYIDGLAYDKFHIYVLKDKTVWKVDRKSSVVAKLFSSPSSITGLTMVGNSVYFVRPDCVKQQCKISIGWVSKDGHTNGTFLTVSSQTGYSTISFVYAPLPKNCGYLDTKHERPPHSEVMMIIELSVAGVLILILLAAVVFYLYWRRNTGKKGFALKKQKL